MENPSILKQQPWNGKEKGHIKKETSDRGEQNEQINNRKNNVLIVVDHGHIQMAENLSQREDLSVVIAAKRIIMQGCAKQQKR